MKKTVLCLLAALTIIGCSSSQSKEDSISVEEQVNHRIESIGKQGQAVKDMIESTNTKQSEFIAALGTFYDTLSNVIQHDESFELTRTCRGYARGLSGDLVRSNLPFMENDSVMELIFKMSICGYYWNMPPSANDFVCSTTALTSGNDYDRMADVMLINEEDEEYYDLFSLLIQDVLGDVNNPSVKIVGEDMTLTLDAHRARYVLDSTDKSMVRVSWPLEDVIDALIPGDKVLVLSYTAGGQEINMQHILLPLPEAWLREYQKTK